jgi:hypothetical protein
MKKHGFQSVSVNKKTMNKLGFWEPCFFKIDEPVCMFTFTWMGSAVM